MRFNFATRWRNQTRGLNYGLSGKRDEEPQHQRLPLGRIAEGLYRPMPNTMTNTIGTRFHLDPFVGYTARGGTRHSLHGCWYRQDFENDNNQSNANDMLYGEYQYQEKFEFFGPTTVTLGVTG